MNIIRKAKYIDINAVALIYEHIIEEEEQGKCTIGWQKGVYPIKDTAMKGLENNDLFVMEEDGVIVAAMRLNKEQVPEYKNCQWEYAADDEYVMVMHTLVVEPAMAKHGYGKKMVNFYETYSKDNNCLYLRIDTNALNTRARAMYKRLGYNEVGITPCIFNGIKGVDLVCIEKKLDIE